MLKDTNMTEKPPAIILIDQGAISSMMGQFGITNSTTRIAVNKHLIRSMEYLSQFNIRFIYKPGREHAVSDTLSRLPSKYGQTPIDTPGELNDTPDDRAIAS
ncbi:uncharacterized protein FTOL_08638 [Fusarium torulosum]|uniref:Uncharacterized protein n=1 Tax=Fusarium torulosum TaxID=33205 RepID=A0AAE8MD44_9HYPO|nr:uncharacterized protein FTOL_08638 [Fusarium torulosum]